MPSSKKRVLIASEDSQADPNRTNEVFRVTSQAERRGHTPFVDLGGPPSGPKEGDSEGGGENLAAIRTEVEAIRQELLDEEKRHGDRLHQVHPTWLPSARNLLNYLTLRHRDLRALQHELEALGLSSLGRSESHVLATVEAVASAIDRLANSGARGKRVGRARFERGHELLLRHARALFGPQPADRSTRIMVTLPSEAAHDPALVKALVAGGMNCARINCAHDDQTAWAKMIRHVRDSARALGRDCRIEMDLAGPKIRTGPIDPSSQVVKWRPKRDGTGRVISPLRVWLTAGSPPAANQAAPSLRVADELARSLGKGDSIQFQDLRGKLRRLVVESGSHAGWAAACEQTVYLRACSEIDIVWHPSGDEQAPCRHRAQVGAPPSPWSHILLRVGDRLLVTGDGSPGRPATVDDQDRIVEPARISCTLPEAIAALREGDPVWIDDGKIGGVVETVGVKGCLLRITSASSTGSKLRVDKGINLPDSPLDLPALTARDLVALDFIVKHADLVALSFVQRPGDIASLQEELRKRSCENIGIILKIETRRGFQHFAELLLTAMRSPSVGVMIARGDLAIECGYERMAEIQEEILWLCEAAHVPVIWATQVLESLAKTGQPSRAEVTDAAMGERAECVMLNKGPFLVEAVHALDDILRRMRAHQEKKTAMMRRLSVADLPDGPTESA